MRLCYLDPAGTRCLLPQICSAVSDGLVFLTSALPLPTKPVMLVTCCPSFFADPPADTIKRFIDSIDLDDRWDIARPRWRCGGKVRAVERARLQNSSKSIWPSLSLSLPA